MNYPKLVPHWIQNEEYTHSDKAGISKYNPANGEKLGVVLRGGKELVVEVVGQAKDAFYEHWQKTSVMERAALIEKAVALIEERKQEISLILSLETGRSEMMTMNEVREAIRHGILWASEAMRFSGFTMESARPNRSTRAIRTPLGVCALIFPFNGPFGGLVKKLFPALLCGNTAISKSHELTPYTPIILGKILKDAGFPPGVFSVLQGNAETGSVLVEDSRVSLISFTGSAEIAKRISRVAANRLAKVSIETGGKNPLVVCDDADLDSAAEAAVSSAFVLSGQVCAAASRIIVFDSVYDGFKQLILQKTKVLKDLSPLMSEERLNVIAEHVQKELTDSDAELLIGGSRLLDSVHKNGYYMEPTILENISPDANISQEELFGPVAILYRVKGFEEALALANNTKYGLTSAVFTQNMNRAEIFSKYCEAGVVRINGPTFGSEPHQLFGGVKLSGNGWREPGQKTLDVYSEWKVISNDIDSQKI